MIELTDEMKECIDNAVADGYPCVVATASRDGRPDVTFKGSMMVFDRESLAFWERSHGTTLANLEENPYVMVLYRNPVKRLAWRFFGVAKLYREGELRQQVMDRTIQLELDRDPERKGVAVIIRVDQVRVGTQIVQQREE